MKVLFAAIPVFIAVLLYTAVTVRAETTSPLITEEKIASIKNHCVENQAALNRLHQTDAFLRNDRGNLYRTISDKLMVPLNQRLASNQLDGGVLVDITASFNREYSRFFDAYIAYDNALSNVLKIDCVKQPVTFYNALVSAREKRYALSDSNQNLKKIITHYGTTFEEFRANYVKENP